MILGQTCIMPGLSFAEDVVVTADTPLMPTFLGWLTELGGAKSPTTVRAYLYDIAGVAAVLLENLGRAPSGSAQALPEGMRVPAGVNASVVHKSAALVGQLTLGDLHPENLARAFADYGSAIPARRRAATSSERRRDSTRLRAAASWTMLCEYATVRGLFAANPMRDPRISRGRRTSPSPTPFEMSEADTLLRTLATADVARTSRRPWPLRDLALASVLLTSGVRLSEICGVRISDVRDVATAPHMHVLGKGGKPRTVPLSLAASQVVATYLQERTLVLGAAEPAEALFVQRDGRAFTPRAMQHLVYRWYTRAGISPRGESCVHALRHTFATQAVNSGASIVEVQELLGHASLETTRRYLKSVGHGLRDAVEAHPGTALVREYAAGAGDASP